MLAPVSFLTRFRRLAAASALLLCSAVLSAEEPLPLNLSCSAILPDRDLQAPLEGELVVHEWGTFTSFSGSDGVRLEFRPLVDQDLPSFVNNRASNTLAGLLLKREYRARQRLETPVTYFYTDRVRKVKVRVAFLNGLLTEFYPPVQSMLPQETPPVISQAPTAGESAEAAPAQFSLLDWGEVTLLPQSALRPDLDDPVLADAVAARIDASLPPGADDDLQQVFAGDHYYLARNTDSALVHVHREAAPGVYGPTGDFFEKFLFYRGIGNFDLPLQVTSPGGERVSIHNTGSDALTGLILLSVENKVAKFTRLADVSAGSQVDVPLPAPFDEGGGDRPDIALARELTKILMAEGLYEKEAQAMVATWSGSWFREPGVRLLYVVPQRLTEELLPLHIVPRPQSTVRVLVGRLEILPREVEQQIEAIVSASAAQRAKQRTARMKSAEPMGPVAASLPEPVVVPEEIRALGRLAEPALQRVAAISQELAVRREAELLIAALHAESLPQTASTR